MRRLHGVVSICLALIICGAPAAIAQQRPTGSRLLRSVVPEKVEEAKERFRASPPARVTPTAPTRRIDVDPRKIAPNRGGTPTRVDDSPLRGNSVRPAPTRPSPSATRRSIPGTLATLNARGPYDLSGSGRYAVATERSGQGLVLIDLAKRKRLRRLEKSKRHYVLVEISADARWIAAVAGQDNERIDLWRADNGRRIRVLKAPGGAKQKLEFSARGNELRVTSHSGEGLVFSVPGGKLTGGFGAASGGSATKKPSQQAPRYSPRVGAAPPRSQSKGEYRSAPLIVQPQAESRARGDAELSQPPNIAAPAPARPSAGPDVEAPPLPKRAAEAAPKKRSPRKAPKKTPKKSTRPPAAAAPRAFAPAPAMSAPETRSNAPQPSLAGPQPTPAGPEPRMAAPQPGIAEPEPAGAAPVPRMTAPAPRAMPPVFDDRDDESGAAPPPAAGAPRFFEHIDSALPEPSPAEAADEAMASPEAASESSPGIFDAVADSLPGSAAEPEEAAADSAADSAAEPEGDGGAEPAAESPAAPGNSTFAQPVESPAEATAGPADEDPSDVTVHYATNRHRLAPKDREWIVYFRGFFSTLPAFVIYALVVLAVLILPWFGRRTWAAYAVLTGAIVLCAMGTLEAYVRSELRDELSGELYGSGVADLSYGTCQVSVPLPENRQAGELNRPVSVWVFQAPENPEKHFMLKSVDEHADKEAFYKSLSGHLAEADVPAALLFIHGYNVSFEDAVFRTAQLAVDLKFPGAAVTFSWPSYADPVKYTFDEQHAEVSIPAFREFLKDMAARSGAERIHVIAHSMGNRVLAGALEQMDRESREINRKVIQEIVLAAPDIDRRVFESQVLPHIAENSQHCTLYASSRDRALLISHYFHNYQRLGETQPVLIVADGMDTIDASFVDTSLLGHSYIGDVQSIVSDLHHLVVGGKRPPDRLGLESLERGEMKYWTIRPQLETAADSSLRR